MKETETEETSQRIPARNNCREFYGNFRALEGEEGNDRKFILSFSSEEPYERWYGIEILDHSEGAVDLTRLQEIGVVLFNHDRDYVVGKILRVWLEEGRACAEIQFDEDDESEKIYQKVKSGTLKGVSVGYQIDCLEEVKANTTSSDGRFEGPCFVATKWMPYEISVVSVPADPTVGVGRDYEEIPKVICAEDTESEIKSRPMSVIDATIQINKNLSQ